MVELALLLPILVFGLIGAADLARAFALQLAIQNGARAGAEAYAINFTPTRALAIQRPTTAASGSRFGRTTSAAPAAAPLHIPESCPGRVAARDASTSASSQSAVAGTSLIGCTIW